MLDILLLGTPKVMSKGREQLGSLVLCSVLGRLHPKTCLVKKLRRFIFRLSTHINVVLAPALFLSESVLK